MRKILFILTALVLILTSCEHKDYFAFDDVSFVRNFPNKYVLGKADTLDVELIGIHGVKSFGDYLLVSCAAPQGVLVNRDFRKRNQSDKHLLDDWLRSWRSPLSSLYLLDEFL